ncbi:YqgE/AlgH family protein [Shinella sp. M31]|jgi:putative transcriptional regulator|uniref:YqgE/AlgH family protein n=1 Tax=Shinella sp. M31 TaxID=3368615 RepID=UPI0028D18DBD|nr:YqgE/AlgH family protein [uncultured Shinella sp.]
MAISVLKNKRERGFLDGQFLIAMPGMADANFARTVVYICAHSEDGAMGFVINRPQQLSFSDVLLHLDLVGEDEVIRLPGSTLNFPIRCGGPVESGRGFVLHSDDYMSESSIPVSDDISLTATLDIVRAISRGDGPQRGLMMLGYAGWGAGQIENEIGANGWLTCPAQEELIFDTNLDSKYERALGLMGITPAMLSTEAGHA